MSLQEDTFPKLFLRNVRKYGSRKTAYREKDSGIWLSKTWQDMHESVESLALGLTDLGVQRGDTVCFVGDNRPEYVWGILAVQSLGGHTAGIYQDALPAEVEYVLKHLDTKIAIVEDQEQTDKLLDITDRLPMLTRIIVDDWKGLTSYENPLLIKLTDVQALGREKKKSLPNLFEETIAEGRGDDIAIISFTSGTTALPKGTMLTYDNLLSMGASLEKVIPMDETDEAVSYLPFAWLLEIIISLCWYLRSGFTVNFPEGIETVQENIREIGPSILVAPPRIWEKMCSEVQVKMLDADWLKRTVYEIGLKIGQADIKNKFRKDRQQRRRWPPPLIVKFFYYVLFRPLMDRLGLSNIKHAFTGGAALGPDVFRFFQCCGLNIKQMYGQTESGGIIATHTEGDVDYETVGRAIPDCELTISDTGEILARGPGIFKGYYGDQEKTNETKDENEYLHTGDFGYINDAGHLVVIDRMKDVIKLSDGSNFSPTFIENRLKFSPFIREAIAVGKDRPFVIALVQIDYAFAGAWAEKRQVPYTTFADLARNKVIYDLIAKEVQRVNSNLPDDARVIKFVLLEKELDADDAELTRTQKLRRGFVSEKYRRLIDNLYEEADR
jgi:long-chain acyl-CoA synthetase